MMNKYLSVKVDETLDDTCSLFFLVSLQTGRGLTVRKYTQTLDDEGNKNVCLFWKQENRDSNLNRFAVEPA